MGVGRDEQGQESGEEAEDVQGTDDVVMREQCVQRDHAAGAAGIS